MSAPPELTAADPAATDRRVMPMPAVFRDMGSGVDGLGEREAGRRLVVEGRNVLPPPPGSSLPRDILAQLVHPLALLLWVAAALAEVSGTPPLCIGIVGVIVLNAIFALVQERQAQRAVQALGAFLPSLATVRRNGTLRRIEVAELVRGDIVLVEEGDRVPADGRLVTGAIELDMSALTGESAPVERASGRVDVASPPLQAPDLVFSGTLCTAGAAEAIVLRTGSHTEIGRIAALTQHVGVVASPLERQVRRVAWLIAGVGAGIGIAFLPLGLLAGLNLHSAVLFSIGLLVANVPEGLLPTITLALASGVRDLARKGAVVKRLSAIETLGSTTVICTDKTGTLTQNTMTAVAVWTASTATVQLGDGTTSGPGEAPPLSVLGQALAASSMVQVVAGGSGSLDPTEVALDRLAADLGADADVGRRDARRRTVFRFDPVRRLSSTVQQSAAPAAELTLYVKGAPESVLARCSSVLDADEVRPIDTVLAEVGRSLEEMTSNGLRVIAVARRSLSAVPAERDRAECELTLVGLAALQDPPRPEVADAVADCHHAGVRIVIVTGDNGLTAAHVARQVGIGLGGLRIVDGADLDRMSERELDEAVSGSDEVVFARSSPEAKLRIADALRARGDIVAMTGDGVNDAPALHRADIGVAMGTSGTEVAREAATMILADDNFATIVQAIRAGRQVYDNVRKFILYIFAHAVPEVVPFLIFALSGGAIPLPLTVMQILAIDLGTETLPALALGKEPAEPGIMDRPPRGRHGNVVDRALLWRAWGRLGVVSAALVMGAFFFVLWRAGWHLGDPTGSGHPLHYAYRQATTATWAGLVACQIGTAVASRTDRASTREVGWFSNRMLLWGIAFEVAFAAAVIWAPPFQDVFGTAPLPWTALAVISVFPAIVWSVDQRLGHRRHWRRRPQPADAVEGG